MPAVSLQPSDLAPFASIENDKAEALIEYAVARAARVAPCLTDDSLSAVNAAAAKGLIMDAILRKAEAGTGAVSAQTVGPFSQTLDTRQPQRVLFWPSEIEELQSICADHTGRGPSGRAFSIDLSQSSSCAPWAEC